MGEGEDICCKTNGNYDEVMTTWMVVPTTTDLLGLFGESVLKFCC